MPRITRAAIALLVATTMLGAAPSPGAGSNKAPNPGFEDAPVDVVPGQPLLPDGWVFEGAAILFDHTQNAKHTGARAAAISGSLSGKRRIGLPDPAGFQSNPANPVKDATEHVYSTTPCWRTAMPIPVQANQQWTLRVWTQQNVVTALADFGAVTKVRWLGANGVPIRNDAGPKRQWRAGDSDQIPTAWEQISREVTAPAGATGAILLLCQADDVWISQVVYDDVEFFQS